MSTTGAQPVTPSTPPGGDGQPDRAGDRAAPRRYQLRRTAGWRLRDLSTNVVIVDRRGKWGNPCDWTTYPTIPINQHGEQTPITDAQRRHHAVADFRALLDSSDRGDYPSDDEIRRQLGGRDLACWCAEHAACHGDVLLERANHEPPNTGRPAP